MSDEASDQNLEFQLIDVRVPVRLLSRLRDIASLSNDELDLRLRDVSLPLGLDDRIHAAIVDVQLDEQLCEIPFSQRVVPRARTIPDCRKRSRILELVTAASLMLLLNVGLLAGVGGILSMLRPGPAEPLGLIVVDRGPLNLSSPVDSPIAIVRHPVSARPLPNAGGELDSIEMMPVLAIADGPTPGCAGQLAREIPAVWDPWDNWLLMRWGVSGFARRDQDLKATLTSVGPPSPIGLAPSLSRSFDREFLFRGGSSPPVLTDVDKSAAIVSPPLTTATTSVEYVRQMLHEGRSPSPERVFVEDFLAAVDYQFAPARPGELAIRTAAGPSVFGIGSAELMQIGVKAGPHPDRGPNGTHLTIAVETSAEMQRGGRFERVREGLRRLLSHLGTNDRLSLVVFSEDAVVAVEEAARSDRRRVARMLEQVSCSGGADLGVGLQLAISSAIETETPNCDTRRLALFTVSQPILEARTATAIQHMFDEAVRQEFAFEVFEMRHGDESAARWAELASSAPCTVHQASSVDEVCWPLVESITGRSSLVASEAKLRVQFNPDAVAAYRLIGHESTAVGGLMPGAAAVDLHVGQEATVLFEVWRHASDIDEIATVHLSWTDPTTGRSRRAAAQRISSLQFATSFEGSPVSLQAASIAAEGAEIMRRGYRFSLASPHSYRYRPKPTNLRQVLSVAGRVNPLLAERSSFQRLVQLLEAAESLGDQRQVAAARAGVRGIIAGRWRESGD